MAHLEDLRNWPFAESHPTEVLECHGKSPLLTFNGWLVDGIFP